MIIYLIENKDRVVTRSEIFESLWNNKVVLDGTLSNHIKIARAILGDNGKAQDIIKTVRGRGYQFIATVSKIELVCKKSANLLAKKRPSRHYYLLLFIILCLIIGWFFYHKQSLNDAVKRIAELQRVTYTAFVAQAERRNELVLMINTRLNVERKMQFEKYFSFYYPQLNDQEKFIFHQIRSITESSLYKSNLAIVAELTSNPQIFLEIKLTRELQQHLIFWLNKYESIFIERQDMCLLYVGVEDGIPYPAGVNKNINNWLDAQ
ncbi:MAG: winged helix-turn-helix domain-containing protein [Paraglaciecola sp.]|nr:winged helix-turn-helix domain-containing protein [Paraglaciecola sp.]